VATLALRCVSAPPRRAPATSGCAHARARARQPAATDRCRCRGTPLGCSSLPAQFSGKDLLNGQTDGSSFPNGGLRATHTAGAFITADPESAPFIMNDTGALYELSAPLCCLPLRRTASALAFQLNCR
jgi:hypothetical protein